MRTAITHERSGTWTNRHENVTVQVARMIDVWNPQPPSAVTILSDINATATLIRELIRSATQTNSTIRAYGGTWSLSSAAVSPDTMLNTKPLNLRFPIADGSVDLGSPFSASQLFYVQCGNSVGEVYAYLERRGRTLRTSGASNGQTIVGAVSTGTHGSAHDFGSMQEMVAAIHLITGPEPDDVLWIERASEPALTANFAKRIGARLVRNDELFNAALVSFGSMGIIMGLLVQSVPLFKIRATRRTVPFDGQLQNLLQSMDLAIVSNLIPDIVDPDNIVHVEVVINPHNTSGNVHLTVMERVPASEPSAPPFNPSVSRPGDDVIGLIGVLSDVLPGLVPDAARAFISNSYPDVGPIVGTPGETFHATDARGKAVSVEIGVPLERTLDALQILLGLRPHIESYAGVIAIRFIKQTRSLLGFAQFPITATFELPAAKSASAQAYYDAAFDAFRQGSVPYTIHWGQIAPATPQTLTHFGTNVQRWTQARNMLLRPEIRPVFENQMVRGYGLV